MYIVLTSGSYTGRIGFQATYASFPSGAQQPIMEPAVTTIAPAPNVPTGGKVIPTPSVSVNASVAAWKDSIDFILALAAVLGNWSAPHSQVAIQATTLPLPLTLGMGRP